MFTTDILGELVPDQSRQEMQDLQHEEGLRLLQDLGYLGGRIHGSLDRVSEKEGEQAIASFRQELKDLRTVDQEGYHSLLEDLDWELSPEESQGELSEEEVQVLRELNALDGDFVPGALIAEAGEEYHLTWRVVRYRLALLGKVSSDFGVVVSEGQMLSALLELGDLLKMQAPLEVIKYIGELDQLHMRMIEQGLGFYGQVILAWDSNARKRKIKGAAGDSYYRSLEEDLPADVFAEYDREIWQRAVRRGEEGLLEELLSRGKADASHALLERLVNLQLWADGYLDASPLNAQPEEIEAALSNLLAYQFEDRELREEAEDRLSLVIADGVATLNLKQFLVLCRSMNPERTEQETLADLGELYAEEPDYKRLNIARSDVGAVRDRIAQQLQDLPAEIRANWSRSIPNYPGRRFNKVLNKVRHKVSSFRKAINRFLDCVRNGLQGLYNYIRKALGILDRSIDLLRSGLGLSTGQGGRSVESRSEGPGHLVHWIGPEADAAILQNHLDQLAAKRKAFQKACELVGTVLQWASQLASGALGWIHLGIKVSQILLEKRPITR